jgi:predicted ATPase/DNA-binding CsgD family transcriptional regulator
MLSSEELPSASAAVPGARVKPATLTTPRLPLTRASLPLSLSSFIGREIQMADVERLLTSRRLVTLTGAGGCGKTRLALEVAGRQRHTLPDEVVFVPLAPIADPGFVAPAVGRALGIWEAPGLSYREAVAVALRDRELLLVLDNFEHLLEAAPLVGEWLTTCPGLRVLATSRERLRVQGEQVYPVPPLSVAAPAPEPANGNEERCSDATPESVAESARLFVERARAVQPGFVLSRETASLVGEICRRLDGLPLAIELAAAQLRVLPPAAMLARLDRRLPLLTSGPRDVPARQRTLRDTIAWSHDLLDEAEQQLFRRLSVFVGGWTLEAAEAVCAEGVRDGGRGEKGPHGRHDRGASQEVPASPLDLLGSLVDKSLILRADAGADGEPRFTMLETIREYAVEQLVAAGEASNLPARHASYHLALAEEAAPNLTGPEQGDWMARLTMAHPDLRAALRWLVDQGDVDAATRLLWALGVFLWARGHIAEAGRWAEEILAAPSLSPLAEARARCVAGMAAFKQGAFPAADTLLSRARLLFLELDDAYATALATLLLGHVIPRTGTHTRGAELMREAIARFESLGNPWGAGLATAGLAVLALMAGDLAEARRLYERFLAMARASNDRRSVGQALDGLAMVALWGNDYERAETLLLESVPICLESGHGEYVAYGLGGLARVAAARYQSILAARLLGTLHHLLTEVGVDQWPLRRDLFAVAQERARADLGDEAYAAALDEGRRMSAADAVRYALAELPAAPQLASGPSPERAASPQPIPGGLSKREVEVARLVAAGKTNREIAEALVVSERTVATHLDHIFTKLAVSSRTAVATFALRHGLA